jgi:hypothetical protein
MDKEVFQNNCDDYPESVDSEATLGEYLTSISTDIGWIIIYFNSLEDMVAQNIRKMICQFFLQMNAKPVYVVNR